MRQTVHFLHLARNMVFRTPLVFSNRLFDAGATAALLFCGAWRATRAVMGVARPVLVGDVGGTFGAPTRRRTIAVVPPPISKTLLFGRERMRTVDGFLSAGMRHGKRAKLVEQPI